MTECATRPECSGGHYPFRARRGKVYDQMVYKIVDWKSHEVLYGEQQNLRLDDVQLLLDATLKAESQDVHGERR